MQMRFVFPLDFTFAFKSLTPFAPASVSDAVNRADHSHSFSCYLDSINGLGAAGLIVFEPGISLAHFPPATNIIH